MVDEREKILFRHEREVEALVRGFEECTVAAEEWTHAAHLVVAAWYAAHYDEPEATRRMRDGLLKLIRALGVETTPTSGYHETMTVCWMRLVRAYVAAAGDRTIVDVANGVVAYGDRTLPFRYYSRALLMSPEARAAWVAPDLAPLPAP